jgi:hypothetical protein
MLTPQNDMRHPLDIHDPVAQESLVFNIALPDEKLLIITYLVAKHNRMGSRILAVIDGNETSDHPALYDMKIDVPARGDDFDDFSAAGMQVQHTDPLREARVIIDTPELSMDCNYTALHEAWDFGRDLDGCPPSAATNRFEQCLAVHGSLDYRGRQIALNTTAHRDHSWGARDYQAIPHWKWVWDYRS